MPDNADKFDALIVKHGGDPRLLSDDSPILVDEFYAAAKFIPNDELYSFLQEIRPDLVNTMRLGSDHIPNSRVGKEVRRRCQTDLFWMARYFTWETNPFSENGTKPLSENKIEEDPYSIFADFFVKKDPTKTIAEQSEVKTSLLLWPRSGMKSTIDHVDTAQWILCFPGIRVLYLTATIDLAEKFVGELAGHFLIREETPSLMNMFWPEFCFDEKYLGSATQFTTPVYAAKKTKRKEPTVIASSVGKNKAGFHYELIKADDGVSDTNTITPEQCASISEQLFLAEKLLDLGGNYITYVGTRYEDGDHYDIMLEQNVGDIVTREGRNWKLMENRTTGVNILIGQAIRIKPEVVEKLKREGKPVTYHEAGEEGCTLLLPKVMPYKWCLNDFTKNEKTFESQRNQNPRAVGLGEMDRLTLVKATVPYTHLPRQGPVSQFWDMAFSQKKGVDYSVGSSVMWGEEDVYDFQGKPIDIPGLNGTRVRQKKTVGYVRKIMRDRYTPFSLARAIVQLAQEERPFVIGIEKAGGSFLLAPTIEAEAIKTGDPQVIAVCSHIDWITADQQKDAKKIRMGGLFPWIIEGRFKFLNACMQPKYQDLEVLYSEFEKCMYGHHDDLPDNLGYQVRYAPRATQAIVENNVNMFSNIDQQGWNQVFNEDQISRESWYYDDNGKLVPFEPETSLFEMFRPEPEVSSSTPHGMPNILGAGVWG